MEGREAISGAGSAPPQPQPQPQPQPPPPVAPPASSATPPPAPVPLSTAPPSLEVVKMENASQSVGVEATGPAPAPATAAPSVIQATVQPPTRPMGMGSPPGSTGSMMMGIMKKKRGRPRKYAPDGSLVMPLALMPPMSMGSPTGEFTLTSGESITMSMKRGRGRGSVGMSSFVKQYARPDYESAPPPPPPSTLGELSPCSYGGGFMPHIINVAAGEDVTMKIISFSQQGPRAICILSATGVISNVTLRQPDSSGGTLTYEGRFELLSLSGSFMPNDIGGARSRSGGMSVSLASPDGRVVGGGVAGLLVAASPVQVVVGSFMPSYQSELKNKKAKLDSASVNSPPATTPHSGNLGESYNGGQGQHSTGILKPSITTTSVRESWASLHPMSDARNSTDINLSLPNA